MASLLESCFEEDPAVESLDVAALSSTLFRKGVFPLSPFPGPLQPLTMHLRKRMPPVEHAPH